MRASRHALLPAVACAIACNVAHADQEEFATNLANFRAAIAEEGDYCRDGETFDFLSSVFFDTSVPFTTGDQASLLADYTDRLTIENPSRSKLRVEAFSDLVGEDDQNQRLSQTRAETIARAFRAAAPDFPVEAVGLGPDKSTNREARNETAANAARRRADILITRDFRVEPGAELVASAEQELSVFSSRDATLGAMFRSVEPAVALPPQGVIEFWFNAESRQTATADRGPEGTQIVMAMHNEDGRAFALGLDGAGHPVIWRTPDETAEIFAFEASVSPSQLHHAAITYNEKTATLWLDGMVAGTVDVMLPESPIEEFVFGGFAPGRYYFDGRLGRLRIWSGAMDCRSVRDLPRTGRGTVDLADSVNDPLIVETKRRASDGVLDLAILPPALRPRPGPWNLFGSDQITLVRGDLLNPASPSDADLDLSENGRLQRELAGGGHAAAALDIKSTSLANLSLGDRTRGEDAFSTYPLFHVEWQGDAGASDPANATRGAIAIPDASRARRFFVEKGRDTSEPEGHLVSIAIGYQGEQVAGGIVSTSKLHLTTDTQTGSVASCAAVQPDEQIEGFSGLERKGRILSLAIHTNRRTLTDCLQSNLAPDPKTGIESFELWLPAGALFRGLGLTEKLPGESPASGLMPLVFGEANRQRIAILREDALSGVFERIDRNRYRSIQRRSVVLPDTCPDFPELTVLSSDELQFNCGGIDFVYADNLPDPPKDTESFDNTFVRLSKAVNLQANYLGYSLPRMDPLHLVETGGTKAVFQMPGGASRDYSDFNRIFVPDGLFYVAEFNGGSVTRTTVSSDTSDYRSHFSQTVSVSGGVEAGKQNDKSEAKFGASNTINRARSIMHGDGHELSIGTSQVALYALVLNKAHMTLDSDFQRRLAYLAAFPTEPNFDAFVRTYGTHYASAVIYGGMGVLELQYDGTEAGSGFENSETKGVNAQASLKGISAGFSFEQTKGVAENFAKEMSAQYENFFWVGGAHVGATRESWGVGVDGVVPIFVDLRPIEELLLPPFTSDPAISFSVRHKLKDAVQRYLDREALEEEKRQRDVLKLQEEFFSITLDSVRVDVVGDELDGTFELGGVLQLGKVESGRLIGGGTGVMFNRPGPQGAETPENAARPAFEFDWDADRVTSFRGGFFDVLGLGIPEIIRKAGNRQPRAVDYAFSTSQSIAGESPQQIFGVRSELIAGSSIVMAARIFEADGSVNEPATGNDDTLTPTANPLKFKLDDFPRAGGAAVKKEVVFKDNSCGLDCTKVTLAFTLRHIER